MSKKRSDKRNINIWTVVKLVGALAAGFYLVVCVYAGITGNIVFLQRNIRFTVRGAYVRRWAADGLCSGIIGCLCLNYALNDLDLWMWRKNHQGLMVMLAFTPGIFLIFLGIYQDIGIVGVLICIGIAAGLFFIANFPTVYRRYITECAVSVPPDVTERGRKIIKYMEWVRAYPVKRLVVALLWLFCIVISIAFMTAPIRNIHIESSDIFIVLMLMVAAVLTFKRVKGYVTNHYHCLLGLIPDIKVQEIMSLIETECFKIIDFQTEYFKKYMPIYESENWVAVGGVLIYKNYVTKAVINSSKAHARLMITYDNGKTVKVGLFTRLDYKETLEFKEKVLQPLENQISERRKCDKDGISDKKSK